MAGKAKVYGSVQVDVELSDIIDQCDDDVCEAIAESIGYVHPDNIELAVKEHAITAIAQIRAGRPDDAIVTLERAFMPAWEDTAACEARYREVMGRAA